MAVSHASMNNCFGHQYEGKRLRNFIYALPRATVLKIVSGFRCAQIPFDEDEKNYLWKMKLQTFRQRREIALQNCEFHLKVKTRMILFNLKGPY